MNESIETDLRADFEKQSLVTHFLFQNLFDTLLKNGVISDVDLAHIFNTTLDSLNSGSEDEVTRDAKRSAYDAVLLIRDNFFE